MFKYFIKFIFILLGTYISLYASPVLELNVQGGLGYGINKFGHAISYEKDRLSIGKAFEQISLSNGISANMGITGGILRYHFMFDSFAHVASSLPQSTDIQSVKRSSLSFSTETTVGGVWSPNLSIYKYIYGYVGFKSSSLYLYDRNTASDSSISTTSYGLDSVGGLAGVKILWNSPFKKVYILYGGSFAIQALLPVGASIFSGAQRYNLSNIGRLPAELVYATRSNNTILYGSVIDLNVGVALPKYNLSFMLRSRLDFIFGSSNTFTQDYKNRDGVSDSGTGSLAVSLNFDVSKRLSFSVAKSSYLEKIILSRHKRAKRVVEEPVKRSSY